MRAVVAASPAAAARGAVLLLLLALLGAAEAKRHRGAHHYSVDAPSTAGVVGSAMGHLELMGEIEDETSRLQSAFGLVWVLVLCVVGLRLSKFALGWCWWRACVPGPR